MSVRPVKSRGKPKIIDQKILFPDRSILSFANMTGKVGRGEGGGSDRREFDAKRQKLTITVVRD
jgi:hypothetical protein